ncbi:hypothetical protein LEP1GSC059_2100 [Leptospira noguchii serovar Panama str. CZ214]|uniref:Uncharacterized protein n=1 Tax=Leptospira noguchii serovar Panama str. CZ214 TaxID=1001595 RepID=T0FII0_9LEPT|nr:hypothetical protein LEP1GSC059_2100 [Leptospira noguchii serovar Panama str. CZ214]
MKTKSIQSIGIIKKINSGIRNFSNVIKTQVLFYDLPKY